jgi:hypothetical protein
MKFQSVGKLRYSPKLTGDRNEKWWLVVDCDRELGRYYRSLFQAGQFHCRKLQAPSWDEHITVLRNEEPPEAHKFLWHKYEGVAVEFSYSGGLETDGLYYWLAVDCPQLLDIREELGLARDPLYPLHLTIGNLV